MTYFTVKEDQKQIAKLEQQFPGAIIKTNFQYIASLGGYIKHDVEMPKREMLALLKIRLNSAEIANKLNSKSYSSRFAVDAIYL